MIELTRENAQLIADALTTSKPIVSWQLEHCERHAAALVAIQTAINTDAVIVTNDNYDLFAETPNFP